MVLTVSESGLGSYLVRKFFCQAFDNMVRVELVLDPDPPPEVMAATQGVEKLLLKEKTFIMIGSIQPTLVAIPKVIKPY